VSRPYYQPDPTWWPAIAAALTASGQPWPLEAIYNDLAWWQDQATARGVVRPGRPALAARWGCTDWAAKQAMKNEDAWGDPRKRRQPTTSAPPAHHQRTTSAPPATDTDNADFPEESASAPPADHQPTTSAPPADRPTRVDPQTTNHKPQTTPHNEQQEECTPPAHAPLDQTVDPPAKSGPGLLLEAPPAPDPVPPWLTKARRTGSGARMPSTWPGSAVLDVLRSALRAVYASEKYEPSATAAAPVLRLWQAMGWPAPDVARERLVLLADAAKDCDDPVFKNDVRGISTRDGTQWKADTSGQPAAVFRIAPQTGAGATWEDRLRVAESWQQARLSGTATAWAAARAPSRAPPEPVEDELSRAIRLRREAREAQEAAMNNQRGEVIYGQ
jgi:hypothetical protein